MATSSGDTLVRIPDDVVKCCSCHTLFDDVDRHPRLLPCLHCICFKCLKENMKSKRNITCRYCHGKIDISENSFDEYPKDCSKTGYVKFNQIKNSNCSFKCHYCEDEPVADFYCMTCTKHLCQYCYEHHKRSKRSHDISLLKDIPVTMETAKMFHIKTKCEVHKGEILDFYCTKCNKCICLKCVVISHKDSEGHKVQEIHSIYKTESEKLLNEKSTVGTLENKIGKTVNAIENEIADVQKYSESVSAEISTAFEDAYKLLKRRKEDLFKEVSSITQDKTTSLQQQMSKLQKQRQDIKDILAHIQLSLACNDHAALVDVLPLIIQKLSRLGASTTDSEPCVKANLVFMQKKLTTSTPLLGHLTTASVYGPNTQFVLPEVIYAGESVEMEVVLSDYNGTAIMDQDIEVTIHVTNVASQKIVLVLTCKLTQKNTWICNGIIPTPGQYDVTVCVQGHLVKLEPKRIEVESVPVMASAQFHAFDPDEDRVDVDYYVDNVDTTEKILNPIYTRRGSSTPLLYGAIDLGTTYSGFAYAFYSELKKADEKNPIPIRSKKWISGRLLLNKTPTCVLLNKNKQFVDFGNDAEDKYSELLEDDKHEDFYFFRGLTTILYEKKSLRRDTTLRDNRGKEMKAIDVVSHCINYLKNSIEWEIGREVKDVKPSDFMYVLTIPAVCDDTARQFMGEAAVEAGIPHDQLMIVSETLAAFVYCRNVSVDQKQLTLGAKGTRYMIADLGGTADITVHERQYDNSLKELWPASGGPWGGKSIDKAFTEFIEDIFVSTDKNCTVLETLRWESMDDYTGLFREFETKKRSITSDTSGKVYITLPVVFIEVAKKCANDSVEHCLEKSKYPEVKFRNHKLQMPAETFRKLFQPTVDGIVNLMDEILSEKSLRDVDTVLMVGGFAECELVQKAIRNKFPKKRIIVPKEAGLAVLKGAVLLGHMPETVLGPTTALVARFTCGIQSWPMWNKDHHPVSKKVVLDGVARCKDVFFKFVERGQQMRSGHEISQVFQVLKPVESSLECCIYISTDTDPMFVDEPSCRQLGVLTVPIPSNRANSCIQVEETMVFDKTELLVRARDLSTNQLYKATFNLLL